MNFYGLWISNTNKEKIQECIDTGIWQKDSYPNEKNREYERKKIDELEIGSKVFLFFGSGEVSISETKFSQYLSIDKYDHSKTIVKVQCPVIGTVQSKNLDDVSLEIEWDKGYVPTEWYMYYRQDGIWRFTDEYDKKLKEALYDIIFMGVELDYKWWAENLNWDRKRKSKNIFENVTKDNVVQAISEYIKMKEEGETNLKREAVSYDLLYNQERYPHKYILGIAHKIANNTNEILDSSLYGATGNGSNSAKKVLEDLGFKVIKRVNNNIEKYENIGTKQSLNQILYGPPGTGKTYNTIDKALKIIDGSMPDNREEAKERFEVLKEAGQIKFVTFHQSYGYEEFVEGIKAKTTENGIEYRIEPGIFKVLCEKSKAKNIFMLGTKIGKYTIVGINNELLKLERENQAIIPIPMYLLKEVFELVDKKIITPTDLNNKTAIDKMSKTTEKYIINGYPNVFRDLAEYYIDKTSISKNDSNYILIIDEINRGNISKIFGELITLIEDSKRSGEDEAVEITLPYSGESFGVPNNLYILGTMNTADRSIALMDTALRRRFEFEEMMPKPELLSDDVEGIDLQRLLSKINLRIEYLYDRDHTIGHAYFIDVKDKIGLDSAMRNKVIPLLQEYFYDDWEKIRLVLNDGFISKVEQKPNDIFDSIDDEFVDEEKYSYDIVNYFSEEAYKKIYE